jgi:hypothetical protein
MARTIHQLTPGRADYKSKMPGLHRDGGGLFLSVKPPMAASWVFRYMLKGKVREMGLGSFPEVSLPEAREKADDARKLKAAGIDPIEARKDAEAARKLQQATAMTLRNARKPTSKPTATAGRTASMRSNGALRLARMSIPISAICRLGASKLA